MHTRSSQSGFTLIEMIVSLAVFSGVITIAVGALLVLVAANNQLQGEQSVMTNLSFALDSMTREMRTGTDYYCDSQATYNGTNNIFGNGTDLDGILDGTPFGPWADCTGKDSTRPIHGVSFIEGGDSISGADDRIVYFYDEDAGQLFRRVGNGDRVSIVSSGIYIHRADFFVTGSTPQSDDPTTENDQASITVFIEASARENSATAERYQVQTTVTQRTLDI